MIGRTEPVKPFDLIWWARHQGHHVEVERCGWCEAGVPPVAQLSRTALQVLVLLATYGNEEGKAWPAVSRIAREAGLAVKKVRGRECESNAVSAAITELTERGLIWRKGRGPGHSAVIELLFQTPRRTGGQQDPPRIRGRRADPPAIGGKTPFRTGGRSTSNDQHFNFKTEGTQCPPEKRGALLTL